MADKELKKFSRQELLEMLLEQTRRADELQEKLAAAEKKLEERSISIENAGSIAQAALKLNKVFEAADAAVAQYIESVKKMGEAAYMPEVPKAAEKDSIDKLISEYTAKSKVKPQLQRFEAEKAPESAKLQEKNAVPVTREIKHLKK